MGVRGQGKFALIDVESAYLVEGRNWFVNDSGYALASINGVNVRMHHLILPSKPGFDVDHINRDKLDNRRSNLRYATRSMNNYNSGPPKTNTSGVKGVSWFKPAKKWRAYIGSRPRTELGYFDNFKEAVNAREQAEKAL